MSLDDLRVQPACYRSHSVPQVQNETVLLNASTFVIPSGRDIKTMKSLSKPIESSWNILEILAGFSLYFNRKYHLRGSEFTPPTRCLND